MTYTTSLRAFALASAALLVSAAPALADHCAALPKPTLHVRLILYPGVPPAVRPEFESLVATIWRGEGLSLQWQADETTSPAPDIWLRVIPRLIDDARRNELALGAVHFVSGVPQPHVLVSYGAVREWMRRERDRRFRVLFFGMSRLTSLEFGGYEELSRRGLAYAAAHEIGHYVLASTTHDRAGLMRRDLVPNTIAAVEHPDLSLSPSSRRRLQERLVAARSCSTSGAPPNAPHSSGGK